MGTPYEEALASVGLTQNGRGFHVSRGPVEENGPYGLNQGEIEVVLLVADGFANAAIAEKLQLSEPGVKWRLTRASRKMGCTTRTQVAVRWVREQEFG